MKWQLYFPLLLGITAFAIISYANGYWKLLWLIMGLYWCGSFIVVLEKVIDEKVEEE